MLFARLVFGGLVELAAAAAASVLLIGGVIVVVIVVVVVVVAVSCFDVAVVVVELLVCSLAELLLPCWLVFLLSPVSLDVCCLSAGSLVDTCSASLTGSSDASSAALRCSLSVRCELLWRPFSCPAATLDLLSALVPFCNDNAPIDSSSAIRDEHDEAEDDSEPEEDADEADEAPDEFDCDDVDEADEMFSADLSECEPARFTLALAANIKLGALTWLWRSNAWCCW